MKQHVCISCLQAKRPGSTVGLRPPVRPFWPVLKNAGQCGQTRSVGRRRTAKWKRTCAVSTFARAVGRGLNADRTECRPPKTAVCGRNADPSHTANHHLATWHGCHSDRSTFRPFGILTTFKHSRYELLYIDRNSFIVNWSINFRLTQNVIGYRHPQLFM